MNEAQILTILVSICFTFQNGKNIGQIDIDSHSVAPFTEEDEILLEFICKQVATQDLSSLLIQGPS